MEGSVIVAGEAKVMDVVVSGGQKKYRIQVSNTKKPLFFYLYLAKRYIKQNNDVELSALGMAIPTVVTIAEILKSSGWAKQKSIVTSTVGAKDECKGRLMLKAKIEIVLAKPDNFEKSAYTAKSSDVAHKNSNVYPAATNSEIVSVDENEKVEDNADTDCENEAEKNVENATGVVDQVSEKSADGSKEKAVATEKESMIAKSAIDKSVDANTNKSANAPEECADGNAKKGKADAPKNVDDENNEKSIASAPECSENAAA